MICKSCQAEVDDKATFCPQCGQPLTTPCPRCHAAVAETARFCFRCGMPLDGSTVCPECGSVVPSGAEFCPECGSTKDGRRKCTDCGVIVEPNCKFCPQCGHPLPAAKPYRAPHLPKQRDRGGLKAYVYGLVRRWTIVAVLAIVFILGFFGMVKFPFGQFSSAVPEIQESGIYDLNMTGTDIVAGMFRFINAPAREKVTEDFESFCINRATKNWTPQKYVEKFGILRLAIAQDTAKFPSFVLQIVSWGILQLGIWCVSLAFLIFETVQAVRFTVRKQGSGGKSISLALLLGLVLSFMPLTCFQPADCAIAIIIILLCTLIGLKICRHTVEGHPFVAYDFLRPIIGITFSIVLLAIFTASVYTIEYAGTDYIAKASGHLSGIIDQITPLDKATVKSDAFFDSLKSLMANASYAQRALLLLTFPPNVLTQFPACSEFVPGFISMGYLTYFCNLAFTGIVAWTLIANLTATVDGKKTAHLAWDAVSAALSIALMVFVIVSVILGNTLVNGFDQQGVLLYRLAGMPIVCVVFACLNLAKSIVFASIDRSRASRGNADIAATA